LEGVDELNASKHNTLISCLIATQSLYILQVFVRSFQHELFCCTTIWAIFPHCTVIFVADHFFPLNDIYICSVAFYIFETWENIFL